MNYRAVVHIQVAMAIGVVAVVAWSGCRLPQPAAASPSEILLGVSWAYAVPLAAAILSVMFQRAASADAILGYRAAHSGKTLRDAVLQNTLEQTLLGVLALAAFASQAPSALFGILPVAAWLFLAGRILFVAGYTISPMWRFFGFSLNFYASLALLAGAAWLSLGG
ncbi:MAG TPA: MAPEG family protein [Rhodanobacteraceae bacterium]|nr:MAPEG family protein [Rhodanobacteraceae bacterium]